MGIFDAPIDNNGEVPRTQLDKPTPFARSVCPLRLLTPFAHPVCTK